MRKYILPLVYSCMAVTILGYSLLGNSARANAAEETAILAGGCFWCVESDYDHVPGVISTTSGYIGGELPNPTYKAVSAGGTGHIEAVKIVFDPEKTSYSDILDVFWRSVDPTDDGGQFCDRGESYKTAIFATTDAQKKTAQSSKAALNDSGVLKKPIVTEIRTAPEFYPAEDYHQDYYNKNPIRYKFYRFSCGRDARVEELWGDQAHQGIMDH
ncbi:peptide-methionine (S)-S-oxide reductase MsrA [Sneathiella sp.]|uniref:peptide-methionine (S)-S-oxide reductase MsrA n=1 Tax=Sneathiella sp. TaxID=1964365 RepID=UPI0025FDDE4F|nr:peptide-methionine (S)-S-oxide reductase MsrA [Sneathiella sp.]